MDPSGKLIYTRNNAVLSANLQTIQDVTIADGNRIPLALKELGTTEIFPTSISHSPNGRFVTVVGDGEYIVYTALAWRNKAFGNGSSFAWAGDSNTYAVLEGRTKIRVYKNFRERSGAPMKGAGSWALDGLHGGTLLGARGSGVVVFWDWESGEVVRRIDVDAKNVSSLLYTVYPTTKHQYRSSGQEPANLLPFALKTHTTSFVSTVTHITPSSRRGRIFPMRESKRRST